MQANGGRIPAEWEPARAVWIGINLDSPESLDLTARLTSALSPHVPVKMLLTADELVDQARHALQERGADGRAVEFLAHPSASFWIRDPVIFMRDAGRTGTVAFRWNTYAVADWFERHLFPDDPRAACEGAEFAEVHDGVLARWIGERIAGPVAPLDVVIEGGAIEVNGDGVLLMSEPLALQRNRHLGRDEIEKELLTLPGVEKVIWLGDGAADDPHMKRTIVGDYIGLGTGGHTDEFVRFADNRTILLGWVDEEEASRHPVSALNRERMQRNYEILSAATDAHARPFRIVKIPMPAVVERAEVLAETNKDRSRFSASHFPAIEGRRPGDRVTRVAAASYLNYLVINEHVVLPTYVEDGTPCVVEERVREIFGEVFPGRTQHLIRATAVNWGGGGIHCATNAEPAGASGG